MRRKYLGPEVTLKIIQPNLLNLTDEEAKTPLKRKMTCPNLHSKFKGP